MGEERQGRDSLPARRGTWSRTREDRADPTGLCGVAGTSGHPGASEARRWGVRSRGLRSDRREDQPAALPASSCLSLYPEVSSGLLKSPHEPLSSLHWAADLKEMHQLAPGVGGLALTVLPASGSCLVLSRPGSLLDPSGEASGGTEPAGVRDQYPEPFPGARGGPIPSSAPVPAPTFLSPLSPPKEGLSKQSGFMAAPTASGARGFPGGWECSSRSEKFYYSVSKILSLHPKILKNPYSFCFNQFLTIQYMDMVQN